MSKMRTKAKYILAIDQGTTGSTANLLNASGRSFMRVNQEFRQFFPKPGWVEHKPEEIWKSVTSTIETCLRKAKVRGEEIAAIGITNQRETVVMWDRKNGKPLANALVWQDRRTADFCEQLRGRGLAPRLRELTGLVIDPYFSATKINWLLENIAGARARAERGELACGTIDSFLLWRLTGGVAHKTDVSNASRTQLMNISSGRWDEELLGIFKVPEPILPQIAPSSGQFGVTKGLRFLPDGIPITGIAGDQQAALFGQACFQKGESKCTFGTGSFLLLNTGDKPVPSTSGLLSTVAWQLEERGAMTYALEGGAFICGAAVQFLRDQLGFIAKSSEIEKLAKSVPSSEGVEFVPALTGIGAPYWNADARGLICGLTRGSTRAHIARATLEAMALQNVEILLAMQKDLGSELRSLRVDGGATANDLLMQIQADLLGVEVVRPAMIETTSAGAGYLAGLGVGLWTSLEQIREVWKINKSFKPKLGDEARATRLAAWQSAVRRALL